MVLGNIDFLMKNLKELIKNENSEILRTIFDLITTEDQQRREGNYDDVILSV